MMFNASMEDVAWFLERGLPRQKAIDCATVAACLRGYQATERRLRGEMAITIMGYLPNYCISNVRVLQRKVQVFFEVENESDRTGRWSLISAKIGNTNALKIDGSSEERLLELMADARKPSFEAVTMAFNGESEMRVSTSSVKRVLNAPEKKQVWRMARDGETEWKKEFERTIHRERPSEPSMLWSIDGFTVQLYYISETGVVKSDLYTIVVCDCCTDKIIGWSIYVGKSDTSEHVLKAVLNAIRRTNHRPMQLQYDNSSGNKAKDTQLVFNRLAQYNFAVAPHNGQVKPIERVYGNRIEGQELRLLPNFKGGNITANSLKVRVNPDALKDVINEGVLPNQNEAIMQLEAAFESANDMKVKRFNQSPNEMWRERCESMTRKGIQRTMPKILEIELFWLEKDKTVQLTKNGLGLRWNGSADKTWYETSDDFYKANVGLQFTVRYNPENLESVALIRDNKVVCIANRFKRTKMALADYEEGDGEMVRQRIETRRNDMNRVREEAMAMRVKKMMPIESSTGRVVRQIDEASHYGLLNSKTQVNEANDVIENNLNEMPQAAAPANVRRQRAVLDTANEESTVKKTHKKLL